MKRLVLGILTFSLMLWLSGCTTITKQRYVYIKPNKKNINKRKFLIHKANCLAKANRSVQMPIQMPCFGTGFSKGYCEGQKAKEMREYHILKDEIVEGCMAKYGYVKILVQ